MFNFFKKKEIEKKQLSVTIDSDIKKEIIQSFDKGSISVEELFNVTQEAKGYIDYDNLTVEQKYAVEAFQDYILYIARPIRAYELEE